VGIKTGTKRKAQGTRQDGFSRAPYALGLSQLLSIHYAIAAMGMKRGHYGEKETKV
jgi:hypothetical protein